jgi:hypothetical protein
VPDFIHISYLPPDSGMATKDSKDGLRDLLDKLETPAVRWALVCVGVVILIRLRLILFAAALPVMAYWHYSNNSEASESSGGAEDSRDDDDDDMTNPNFGRGSRSGGRGDDEDKDFNDKSFWASDEQSASRSAPRQKDDAGRSAFAFDDDDRKDSKPRDDDGGLVDDFPKAVKRSNVEDILGSLGSLGGKDDGLNFGLDKIGSGLGDFDFLGSGGGDMDFLGGGFGGGFGGKGKGKGKKGDREKGEGKGDKGPREPNPKQLFIAGTGDLAEDEIRDFFEEIGEVERIKLLTNEDGSPKGVCFVTFRTEEQAQQALGKHESNLHGRRLTVRLAHGGGKGKEGGKDGDRGKGFGKDRDRDRAPMDFGGSERFGGLDGGERRMDDRPRGGGKGKGGGGRGRNERNELDELLDEAVAENADGPVKTGDFDYAARRFLSELRSRDRADGTEKFAEAMEFVMKYTSSKDRGSVRKWTAYIYTLLRKFDPNLAEQMAERDAARRAEKGVGRGETMRRDDD